MGLNNKVCNITGGEQANESSAIYFSDLDSSSQQLSPEDTLKNENYNLDEILKRKCKSANDLK